MKYYSILFILLLINAFSVQAQDTDAMLFGDIKSGEQHIPFATVTIKGTTLGTAADATGHFKMTDIPLGKQIVVVTAIGYKTFEESLNFEKDKSITLRVELEPDNIGLDQVVISADRNEKSRREAAAIVNNIGAKIMSRTQNVTLSEGLSFSPGLRLENNCQNCGFSQVRMNGMESHYTQILINSRPVFSELAGVYGIELIPANMIERIEVVRGGGSAMYGSNAIAGTINLITKDPVNNTFSAGSSMGVVGAGLENESGGAKSDYSLNFNGSFVTDDFKSGLSIFGLHRNRGAFDLNNDGFSEMTSIDNTTLGARLYHRVASRGKLTADFFNINEFRRGGDSFELPPHEAQIAEVVRHQINSGAFNFDLLARENDQFSAFFSAQKVKRETYYGANQDPAAYGFTEDFTYTAGVQYSRNLGWLLFSPSVITMGAENNGSKLNDTKLGYFDPDIDIHFGNTEVAKQQLTTTAAFLQNEWKFKKAFFSAGLRFDHYVVADNLNLTPKVVGNVFSPRINLLYNVSHGLQARIGYAGGFRAPQIFDEDLHIEASGARKVIHENAQDLKQETSNSFTFSLDFTNHFGKWETQLLAESFYTRLNDPFANEYGLPDENGIVVYTRVNATEGAVVKGLNLELNAAPSALFQIQSGFTFQKTAYEVPHEFNETRFFRSPNNYGYLSFSYSPALRFSIAATANYTGSMLVPYFGPTIEDPGAGELRKSNSFIDTGLKITYELKLSDDIIMELNSGVKNILNSFQDDLDTGAFRDPSYIYGPTSPRTIYFGVKIGNFL
ncbi:MAG: TonB-dependent receptor [Prolixibacteraceae bacterium]|jgi:outer membrane receptor for ferrienterochelin and colicins|nr:TonB-dependent receptor [Prolixibacteraceae bacterium]MBT6998098.1 TonB-dependent receptor [Prolixibacteraceae bacterium]MBT7394628.1 TonB-dependent receptor [Prolixibacteraceae bacterium]